MIVIIDYGMGNLGSIQNMLKKIGVQAEISSKRHDIESADKLILPGVGAFDAGLKNLDERGLIPVLQNQVIKNKTPILGICLGMQLMTKSSEEGDRPGLGWIDATTVRFKFGKEEQNLKIPHMGWNTVNLKKQITLFRDMFEEPRFYFVHSYHVICNNEENILATTNYGDDFVSAFQKGNIIGVQFHPEKSHKFGMKILKNFVDFF